MTARQRTDLAAVDAFPDVVAGRLPTGSTVLCGSVATARGDATRLVAIAGRGRAPRHRRGDRPRREHDYPVTYRRRARGRTGTSGRSTTCSASSPIGHPHASIRSSSRSRPAPCAPARDRACRWVPSSPTSRRCATHVQGEGVFTIPYGPVRSGVFEAIEYLVETPGEDIPHVRTRVSYKHRGVEARFEGLNFDDGVLLAERCEGVASVAHAIAFCQAVERIAGVEIPDGAGWVRVLHAELERVANHLDSTIRHTEAAGQAVAYARFSLHKERVQRLRARLCGSRFGRGVVVPGGVTGAPGSAATSSAPRSTSWSAAFVADTRAADGDAFVPRPAARDRGAHRGARRDLRGPSGRSAEARARWRTSA